MALTNGPDQLSIQFFSKVGSEKRAAEDTCIFSTDKSAVLFSNRESKMNDGRFILLLLKFILLLLYCISNILDRKFFLCCKITGQLDSHGAENPKLNETLLKCNKDYFDGVSWVAVLHDTTLLYDAISARHYFCDSNDVRVRVCITPLSCNV